MRDLETKQDDPSNSKLHLGSCSWTGKLCEYKWHVESCILEKVKCKHCGDEQFRGYTRSGYCNKSECNVASARQYLARKKIELAAASDENFNAKQRGKQEDTETKQAAGNDIHVTDCVDLDERVRRACFAVDKMLKADTASVSKPITTRIVRKRDRLLPPRPWASPERSPAVQQSIRGSTEIASNEEEINDSSSDDRDYSAFIMASVRLLVDKEMAKIRNEVEAQTSKHSQEIQSIFLHRYLMDFCKDWARNRPESMRDFKLYRPTIDLASLASISSLLCGIPGLKGTSCASGLFPVILQWSHVDLPPRCRFPQHFHHANVPATGMLLSSEFIGDWSPEMSIPVVLLKIQYILAHPNHSESVNDDAADSYRDGMYGYKVLIQTSQYKPESFLNMAKNIESNDEAAWQIVGCDAQGSDGIC